MQHRVLAAATIAGALWAHGTAAACNVIGPYLGTGPQLPLGCPLHVYFSGPVPISGVPYVPMVTAMRGAGYVDVTGAISTTPDALQVEQTFVPCPRGFQLPPEHRIESYGHFAVSLKSVQVGDQIGLDTGWLAGIAIVAAAPCAASIAPMPACIDMVPCPGDDPPFDDGSGSSGCHAAAGGGLGAGAALLGLRRRARRRR
jgi:hypothetical protein